MQLLFVTQVLDRQDAVLGFVTRWVERSRPAADRVRVLALEVGDTADLPPNVDWVELGRKGAIGRYLRYRSAVRGAVREGFDGLLTHMVPRYSVVAGPLGQARRDPALPLVHPQGGRSEAPARDRAGGRCVHGVRRSRCGSTRRRRSSPGTGSTPRTSTSPGRERKAGPLRLLSVGRVTPAKDPLTVVEALGLLRQEGVDVELRWAGGALARGDDEYAGVVRRAIEEKGLESAVDFVGAVPYPDVPSLYRDCDLFVNASRTGSVDKVVLEAMAASRPFVSCNESIPPLLDGACSPSTARDDYAFRPGDPESLASAIRGWIALDDGARTERSGALARMVRSEHDVDVLMERLIRRWRGRLVIDPSTRAPRKAPRPTRSGAPTRRPRASEPKVQDLSGLRVLLEGRGPHGPLLRSLDAHRDLAEHGADVILVDHDLGGRGPGEMRRRAPFARFVPPRRSGP